MRKTTLILVLFTFLSVTCTDRPAVEEGFVEVNGTSLFYKTMGSGEPIVVLHGGPGFDHRQFLPYIWELAARHKVILFDQRGTGLSSGPIDSKSISIDSFIADIEGVRNAFGIERMNLLGHSWGGILAMHYGVRHPENLRSLVLCSTAASFESFGQMRETYEANRLPDDAALLQEIYSSDGFQNGDPQAVERFWRIYFKPYFADQELASRLDLQFTENSIRYGNEVAGHIFESIGEFDLHDPTSDVCSAKLQVEGNVSGSTSALSVGNNKVLDDFAVTV